MPNAKGETKPLPRPPGMRLETLPRKPQDKPQEVSVAVNPCDPLNAIVSFHQAMREGSDHHPDVPVHLHIAWTADGGETWTIAQGTTHEQYLRSLDAAVAFDIRGHAYVAYIGMNDMTMTARHGEFLGRSLDGGRTWEPPVALVERPEGHEPLLEHFPNIVADNHARSPRAGNVYVLWDRILGEKSEMVLVHSTDGGDRWSAPEVISTHSGHLSHSMAVGPDGALYVAYITMTAHQSKDQGPEISVQVSRDGGATFEGPQTVARVKPPALWAVADFPRACGVPNIAVDPRDPTRLWVAWGDFRHGDGDILAATSSDGGRTWAPPVRVNDDPPSNGKDQWMHWLAVDPTDGAVYVLFYDRRADEKNLLPTITLARSIDGGRAFANYAFSDAPSDPKQACLGDYIGIAALDGRVYAAWVEDVPAEQQARKPPQKVKSGDMELDERRFPSGPSAIKVGIAGFRS